MIFVAKNLNLLKTNKLIIRNFCVKDVHECRQPCMKVA